jgi:SAM-dependent methyltransferase
MTDLSSYPSGYFDLVYSGQSIEHVRRQEANRVLAQVRRVLRPGGFLALDTPNRELTSLQQKAFIDPDHKYEYSHREMAAMLRGNGFVVEQAVGINYGGDAAARGVFDVGEVATKRGLFHDITDCYLLGYVCSLPRRPSARTLADRTSWWLTGPDTLARRALRFASRRITARTAPPPVP